MERPSVEAVRWTTEDQWHVTLLFLGEVADGGSRLREALDRTRTYGPALPASVAVAGPRARRLGEGVWALPVEGLAELAGTVAAIASGAGMEVPAAGRGFRGHLTLARSRGGWRGPALRTLEGPGAGGGTDLSCTWAVGEVTLVESRLHPGGARYEVIGRWAARSKPRAR
jgi:2'-5' RNA ligase